MKHARPQRTVSISLSGRFKDDAGVNYSYWSPHDGLSRIAIDVCDLYHEGGTNTLFVLDYASTLNGWTIVDIRPHAGSASLESVSGPAGGSILTIFPDGDDKQVFNFYIDYYNTLSEAEVSFDPQEANVPH